MRGFTKLAIRYVRTQNAFVIIQWISIVALCTLAVYFASIAISYIAWYTSIISHIESAKTAIAHVCYPTKATLWRTLNTIFIIQTKSCKARWTNVDCLAQRAIWNGALDAVSYIKSAPCGTSWTNVIHLAKTTIRFRACNASSIENSEVCNAGLTDVADFAKRAIFIVTSNTIFLEERIIDLAYWTLIAI